MVKVHQQTTSFAAKITLLIIRGYQLSISPLLGPRCRFYPSCSQYAVNAITAHGFFTGSYLALRRLLKCHPGHAGGIDEVPCSPHHSSNE
jgi:hypothetical protein